VRVKVLKFHAETERVSLGLKQISDDPWSKPRSSARHLVCAPRSVSLQGYGAFIELEQGIRAWSTSARCRGRGGSAPVEMVAVGDTSRAVASTSTRHNASRSV